MLGLAEGSLLGCELGCDVGSLLGWRETLGGELGISEIEGAREGEADGVDDGSLEMLGMLDG
jgi:hypothetical protein